MDPHNDRRILRCNVLGAHLHHRPRYRPADYIVQRSHWHSTSSKSGKEFTVHEITQLVLFGDNDVFSVWRECHILFQAHCARGQGSSAFCYTSSLYQLYALRFW